MASNFLTELFQQVRAGEIVYSVKYSLGSNEDPIATRTKVNEFRYYNLTREMSMIYLKQPQLLYFIKLSLLNFEGGIQEEFP